MLVPRTLSFGLRRFWLILSVWVLTNASAVVFAQPQDNGPDNPKQIRYWTTNWNFENIDIGKLVRRLSAVGIELDIDLQGTASVKFDVGVPINALRDGAAYRFDGTLSSPNLSVDGIRIRNGFATLTYRDGIAQLSELRARVIDDATGNSGGDVSGKATAQLVPQGSIDAELAVQDLSIGPIIDLVESMSSTENSPLLERGLVTGSIKLKTPIESVADISEYELSGSVAMTDFKLRGLPAAEVEIPNVSIAEKVLTLDSFSLSSEEQSTDQSSIRLVGSARLPLNGSGDFQIQVAGDDVPVGASIELFAASKQPLAVGKLDFRAIVSGTLASKIADTVWKIDASVASPDLSIAGVELGAVEHNILMTPTALTIEPRSEAAQLPPRFRFQRISSEYEINDDSIVLRNLNAVLFGGQLEGNATIPTGATGEIAANVDFSDIRPEVRLPFGLATRPKVGATFSGNLNWKVPIESLAKPIAHSGQGEIRIEEIAIGRETVGSLDGTFQAAQGDLSVELSGELFGGTVDVSTRATAESNDRWSDLPKRLKISKLRLHRVPFQPLLSEFGFLPADVSGTASGTVVFEDLEDASVDIVLRQVRRGRELVTRRTQLKGEWTGGTFIVNSLVGDYADGAVRIAGRVKLLDADQHFRPLANLHLTASRIKLTEGLWFLGPLAEDYAGRASGSATIGGYLESLRVRGNIDGRELVFYDLKLGNAHSAIAAEWNAFSNRWRLQFPSVQSQAGGGQLDGKLILGSARRSGGGVDIESEWRARRVDFFQITNAGEGPAALAHGEISGGLTLAGKSVQSIDGLSGRFNFKLGDTRGAAVPGLISVGRFLGPVSLATERFDVGEARGLIGSGSVVLDEFWLGSDTALVRADGKIYIRSGRMNLTALIATGDYGDISGSFAELTRKYALRSLLPASAIFSITELLRDRTVVVNITGTAQNPIVRLRPVETFREETVRFLLREGRRLILAGLTAEAALDN